MDQFHHEVRPAVLGTLTHAQLAAVVADVQAILWKEPRMLPDFPREYGEYRNPAKEWEPEHIEQVAEILEEAGLERADIERLRDLAENLGFLSANQPGVYRRVKETNGRAIKL